MTLINLGLALAIFLVLKPWRFFSEDPLAEPWPRVDGRSDAGFVYRHEVTGEPENALFTSDGRVIL